MNDFPEYPIELLAPARDLSSGQRAIDCGADAVYIGAGRFGARENAANSLQDIAQLCDYSHRFWARVYVTINTLLHDHELAAAVQLIQELYDLGADAIIIQDVGLLECDLPPIRLIASTQMHNQTAERVRFLQSVGLSRVILARELSFQQIKEIRQNTQVELECFIHGAICVGYSGQCYLSYSLGGRSGNRGQCAQPCRKLYTLQDADGKTIATNQHLLSLKDLNASEHLEVLLDAGVTSFKIEGRLKDTPYIMNAVSFYRQQLDRLIKIKQLRRSSSGASNIDFQPNLDKTFNRGYTDYFLKTRHKMAALDTPQFVGEPVGKITNVARDHILLDQKTCLHNGDGVSFFNEDGRLLGVSINQVLGPRIYPNRMLGLAAGVLLYRNHDHEFIRSLEKSRAQRRIKIAMIWQSVADGFQITARDEDGISVTVHHAGARQPAMNPEQALAQINRQLCKLGDSEFACDLVVCEKDDIFFLPLSVLNAIRRTLVERLLQERIEKMPRHRTRLTPYSSPYPLSQLGFRANVLNDKARQFYRRHGVEQMQPAAESGVDLLGETVMTCKYCLRYELDLCGHRLQKRGFTEPLYLVDAEQNRLQLLFDCSECVMHVILDQKGKEN